MVLLVKTELRKIKTLFEMSESLGLAKCIYVTKATSIYELNFVLRRKNKQKIWCKMLLIFMTEGNGSTGSLGLTKVEWPLSPMSLMYNNKTLGWKKYFWVVVLHPRNRKGLIVLNMLYNKYLCIPKSHS